MTLDEFVTTYNGTKVVDGQCVALIKRYEEEVLGIEGKAIGNAHNYYDNYETEEFLYTNYIRIEKTEENYPQKGDLVVWNTNVGNGAGHIAIAYSDFSTTSFKSFDQNWSQPLLCTLETHSYNNVSGWLRFRGTTPEPSKRTKKHKFPWFLYFKKRQ